MKILLTISTGIALITLGACTSLDQPSDPFGTSVRHNIAAQTVHPTDEQKQNTYIRPNQERMNLARDRYKADEVEKPKSLETTDG